MMGNDALAADDDEGEQTTNREQRGPKINSFLNEARE